MTPLDDESSGFKFSAIVDQATVNKPLPKWDFLGEAEVVTLGSPALLIANAHLMQSSQNSRLRKTDSFSDLGCG